MNKLQIILPFFLLLIVGNNSPGNRSSINYHLINPCPGDDETNHSIMEEYLTIQEWSNARQETNTSHLETSQIEVLQSPVSDDACQKLNKTFQGFLEEKWPDDNTRKYDVSYYKAGNFYFVVISLKQPEEQDVTASGVAYLTVYDSNLNKIKGYAF